MHIVLITVVLDFSGLVLAEAVLSYVNIGVDPTMNSWGNMINSARLELAREPVVWWSLLAAFHDDAIVAEADQVCDHFIFGYDLGPETLKKSKVFGDLIASAEYQAWLAQR